jgi:hypothetical protein
VYAQVHGLGLRQAGRLPSMIILYMDNHFYHHFYIDLLLIPYLLYTNHSITPFNNYDKSYELFHIII